MNPLSRTVVSLTGMSLVASSACADVVPVTDFSFEIETASLANPLLNPPLSGTIGGWRLERSALADITGLTVPRIGMIESGAATDGDNIARVLFIAGVIAEASFSQELDRQLHPRTRYTLAVDVGAGGVVDLLATVAVRVYAGDTLFATSEDPRFLTLLELNNDFDTFVLSFCGGMSPPDGNIRIELAAANTLGVLSGAAFDNVRFDATPFECPCNFNSDCFLNSQDFFDFLVAFFALDASSDFNADQVLNSQDYFDFCTCFFGGLESCI